MKVQGQCSLKSTTGYHFGFPSILLNPHFWKRRYIPLFGGSPSNRKYLGTKKDILFSKLFRFNEIDKIVEALKSHIMEYYQDPASKGYSGYF